MKIGIVGLGLIGGSMAKAIKKRTEHTVLATDIDNSVMCRARLEEAIHGELTEEELPTCDFVILALYPKAIVEYVKNHAHLLPKDGIVMDVGGIKRDVLNGVKPYADEHGFTFVGAHPMAGVANSGFAYSKDTMFVHASMILTPYPGTSLQVLDRIHRLCVELGFSRNPVITAEEHDKMISYTSQLAHVVSSAYVRDPLALEHKGYSAGSFRDMTRVAKLNAGMWTELFFENKDFLADQIDALADRMKEYSAALRNDSKEDMMRLLEEGTEYKLKSMESENPR
ncbi:MAG: prephenate dehydrogenase [Clostridia bacterium]|nr:prephenate dehydrogenase [Clostridia bacterium]